MRIAYSTDELHERGFLTSTRADLTLIVPGRAKRTWEAAERPLRSALIDRDRRVVSLGFPKFFNWGEDPDDTAALTGALRAGEPVWFAEKLDGSLCIRSVIGGQVVLRTRGTFDGGDHAAPMRALAAASHPRLLDPGVHPQRSLLFEFTSPQFPIVITYPRPALTLIGAVEHTDGSLVDRAGLVRIADELAVPLAPLRELPRDPQRLVGDVSAFRGAEGIVASCAGGRVLVKVKSAAYLRAHALRFALSARRVAELCVEHDVRDEAHLRALICELAGGHEFELEQLALATFARLCERRDQMARELSGIERWVAERAHLDRREFAAQVTPHARERSGLYFSVRDGRVDRARDWLHRRLIDEVAARS